MFCIERRLITWIVNSLLRSILMGSLYALMALGLTLTIAVIKLPNFAHAELITVGAYVAAILTFVTDNIIIVAIGSAIVGTSVALVCHRVVYRPLAKRGATRFMLVLASFAVGLVIRYIIFLWGSATNLLEVKSRIPVRVVASIGGVRITNIFVWSVPLAIASVTFLYIFLTHTRIGKCMRAISTNESLSRIVGVNVDKVIDVTWVIVGGLTGVSGAFLAIYITTTPLIGWTVILEVFTALVLGGLTSVSGAMIGGYVVGSSENIVMDVLYRFLGVELTYKPIIPFIILVMTLLFSPRGLMGLLSEGSRLSQLFRRRSSKRIT